VRVTVDVWPDRLVQGGGGDGRTCHLGVAAGGVGRRWVGMPGWVGSELGW
jgi:hypothetical protein